MKEYQAERVVDSSTIKGVKYYLIKWMGYPQSQNTWEPIEHLQDIKDLIKQWEQNRHKLGFSITQSTQPKLHRKNFSFLKKNRKEGKKRLISLKNKNHNQKDSDYSQVSSSQQSNQVNKGIKNESRLINQKSSNSKDQAEKKQEQDNENMVKQSKEEEKQTKVDKQSKKKEIQNQKMQIQKKDWEIFNQDEEKSYADKIKQSVAEKLKQPHANKSKLVLNSKEIPLPPARRGRPTLSENEKSLFTDRTKKPAANKSKAQANDKAKQPLIDKPDKALSNKANKLINDKAKPMSEKAKTVETQPLKEQSQKQAVKELQEIMDEFEVIDSYSLMKGWRPKLQKILQSVVISQTKCFKVIMDGGQLALISHQNLKYFFPALLCDYYEMITR